MLPPDLWTQKEPRFAFPVFGDAENRLGFTLPHDLVVPWTKTLRRFASGVKRRQGFRWSTLADLLPRKTPKVGIRGAFLTRSGEFLGRVDEFTRLEPGQCFEASINGLLERSDVALQDGMFVVIMNRGRRDAFDSSGGSFSMNYEGDHFYTCYRTGAFGRILNDFRIKRHSGFMSVNPKVVVDERLVSSIFLINHSSWPEYDDTVFPTVELFRPDGESMTTDFGPVPPFGGIEHPVDELFPSAQEFLAPFGGKGMTVTRVDGYSLAGVSILRSRDGREMAIEHTRPTQAYLINGA